MQAAAFTRKPTSAALRLFALCASRLTAHQSWRRLDCSALRCAAESVPPSAIGSLLTAFPKRIRLALVVRVHWGMRCAPTPIRQSPQAQCSTSRWSTPMAHRHTLSFIIRLLPCLRFTAQRHRLITKLRRKQVEPQFRHTIFGEPKISEKAEAKVGRRNRKCLSVHRLTLAILPHIPLGRKGEFLNRSVGRSGGLCRLHRGAAPNPRKGCYTAF